MNKIFLLIFGIFLISNVLAITNTIVETEFTLEYNPAGNCIENCVNITENHTTCSSSCSGILIITGENLLKEIVINSTSFTEIIEHSLIRTFAENKTDITDLVERIDRCMDYEGKMNACLDAQRNVTIEILECREGASYEPNYTACNLQKVSLQSDVTSKDTEITNKDNELKDLKDSRQLWGVGGIIIASLFWWKGIPYLRNRNTESDPASKGQGSNIAY